MKFNCPTCRQPLLAENINVQTDLAVCKACGNVARVSELADMDFDARAVANVPAGAWTHQYRGETVVGATTRSPVAFFLVPFMCVWSGGSLGGIYGAQLTNGKFDPVISLFGLPFLIGSVFFWSIALMAICGKVEIKVHEGAGTIFTGVGRIGWKRAFNLDDIESIEEGAARTGTSGKYPLFNGGTIVLRGKTLLSFGNNLNEARRYFIFQTLRQLKARRSPQRAGWR
jgi:hypothetical protein